MRINLRNNVERNYHGITADQQQYLLDNSLTVHYDDINEEYSVYDPNNECIYTGNDMTGFSIE